LSDPVVAAMLEAGLFTMARPRSYGGLELDPVGSFRVVEEVARHDSAAGWNLNLSTATDYLLAWFPDDGADEVLGTGELVLAAVFNPPGAAVPVDGGYRVSGQWRFVSGCQHAKWIFVLVFLMDGATPRRDEAGRPQQLMILLPAAETQVLDTWYTLGMRGTGSHDVRAEDVFVPARRAVPLAPLQRPGTAFTGPLYRLTLWPPIALLAPPALGIARAAIDDLLELAAVKTPSFTGVALRDRQVVQRQLAQAEAELDAGRALLYAVFDEAWQAAVAVAPIELDRKLRMQLATSHAVTCAARAVDLVHGAAGSAGIRDEYRYQRHFRDIHTITQHAFASAQRYESVGAVMLGAESDWGFFPF
jgi:alkylation response protein AidB-like acyl-CoA dehydrogenase